MIIKFCGSGEGIFLHGSMKEYLIRHELVLRTVEPRNNSLAFKGSPIIKVNILKFQTIVFNVISLFFKGYLEVKVKNLQSQ